MTAEQFEALMNMIAFSTKWLLLGVITIAMVIYIALINKINEIGKKINDHIYKDSHVEEEE